MLIAYTLAELRQHLLRFERPAFVPTMGNLHEGHLHLLQVAKPLGDVLVASIFVNRLQFLPHVKAAGSEGNKAKSMYVKKDTARRRTRAKKTRRTINMNIRPQSP